MQKRKIAVIGVGNMGKNHLRVYSQLPNVEIVGIADINIKLAKKIAKTYATHYYRDYEELWKKEKPDAVSIVVPTLYHFDVASFFLKNRVDTLLEKPIASNYKQAIRLINLSNKSGRFFTVGHIERFNPVVLKMKSLIKRGKVGEIIAISAKRVGLLPFNIVNSDVLIDIGIHDIDIANHILEEFPKKITIRRSRNGNLNIVHAAEALIEYKNASALIQVNWLTPIKIRQLTVTGTKGYLELDYISQTLTMYKLPKIPKSSSNGFENILMMQPVKVDIPVEKKEPLREELIAFLHRSKRCVSPKDAAKALKVCMRS